MFCYQMQASFEYNRVANKLELYSTTLNKRIDFSGPEVDAVQKIVDQLTVGVWGNLSGEVVESLAAQVKLKSKDVSTIFNALRAVGAIITGAKAPTSEVSDTPFDRQIRFFSSFETDLVTGLDYQNRLSQKKVVIVGMGGYGTWLSLFCVRMGIGSIVGIDFDTVEISNLDRQVLYRDLDAGRLKVEAAGDALKGANLISKFTPVAKRITEPKDLLPEISDADLVFNPFSYYRKSVVNQYPGVAIMAACTQAKVPLLSLGGNIIGPLTLNMREACYLCAVEHLQQTMGIDHHKRNVKAAKRAFAPILANTCSIAAFEAACFLGGFRKSRVTNALLHVNWFSDSATQLSRIAKTSNCPAHCQWE